MTMRMPGKRGGLGVAVFRTTILLPLLVALSGLGGAHGFQAGVPILRTVVPNRECGFGSKAAPSMQMHHCPAGNAGGSTFSKRLRAGVSAMGGAGEVGMGGGGGGGRGNGVWNCRANVGGGSEDSNVPDESGKEKMRMSLGGGGILMARRYRGRRGMKLGAGAVTQALLAINVAVFLLSMVSGGAITAAGAMIRSNILAGEWYRLMSPIFLHASTTHLLVNCMSLNAVGPQVESIFGKDRLLVVYLMSGIAGNLMSCYLGRGIMSVGASGSIFGLVGALASFYGGHEEMLGPGSRSAMRSIAQTIVINLGFGLMPGSNIDNWGHLGGVLGGVVCGYMIGPNFKVKRYGGASVLVDEPRVPLPWATKRLSGDSSPRRTAPARAAW